MLNIFFLIIRNYHTKLLDPAMCQKTCLPRGKSSGDKYYVLSIDEKINSIVLFITHDIYVLLKAGNK